MEQSDRHVTSESDDQRSRLKERRNYVNLDILFFLDTFLFHAFFHVFENKLRLHLNSNIK